MRVRRQIARKLALWATLGFLLAWTPAIASTTWNVETGFSITNNPNGPWVYGWAPNLNAGYIITPYDSAQSGALQHWASSQIGGDPCVVHNTTDQPITYGGPVPAHSVALHPGGSDQKSIIRWIAPTTGTFSITGAFFSVNTNTTDVHIMCKGGQVFSDSVGISGSKPFTLSVTLNWGQAIDFAVGYGSDHDYGFDTTGLAATITLTSGGDIWDAQSDFSAASNPNAPWTYGCSTNLNPGYSFVNYDTKDTVGAMPRWRSSVFGDCPCLLQNPTDTELSFGQPVPAHTLAMHPGPNDQKAMVRWTAPKAGRFTVFSTFVSYGGATTDCHVLLNRISLFDQFVNGDSHTFRASLDVVVGDKIDFALGYGQNGNYGSDCTTFSATIVTADPNEHERLSELKQLGDGTPISLGSNKVVTAASGAFADGSLYIEEPDRSCGIRVVPVGTLSTVAYGDQVTLDGTMGTDENGQRVVRANLISANSAGDALIPVGATCRGVANAGLDMTGLLVKVWGKVTQVDPGLEFIRISDGSGPQGIKVLLSGLTNPVTKLISSGDLALVTGIVGLDSSTPGARVVRVRGNADIKPLAPPAKSNPMTAANQWIMSYFGPSAATLPFTFTYNGQPSSVALQSWTRDYQTTELDSDRTRITITYTKPGSGTVAECIGIVYSDFPAVEWLLTFENTGSADTAIIENVQNMDMTFQAPIKTEIPYKLHKTNGSPANPTDFEYSLVSIDGRHPQTMSGSGGRSSQKDFPFFKIETADASIITAVGWSGQWSSSVQSPDDNVLHVKAGLELTHFKLHPGEKVRGPRMLVLYYNGDTLESNALFRQLIYKHYAAKQSGVAPAPTLFSNTCFTRGGGWLNETTEENQISLINAYAPLGLQAVITDAGWFTGGWPDGAGNWDPRVDHYPNGMGPVAAAAAARGMTYGLWFEPERVVPGTDIWTTHPEWCLGDHAGTQLLDFGLPAVQQYFFSIVDGFMVLPGFRVYRQDFNVDPAGYWWWADTSDRRGVSEMKYIEGLYAYWDLIATNYPDSLREECASGGRRIDLETVTRMHMHQDSDYWFDYETDQAQTWGVSQYLPNNCIVQHLRDLDDYSFRATMASSLCIGWIADDPGFNSVAAKRLTDKYIALRSLFTGSWYPLTPYNRDTTAWMAQQWYRPDLEEGVVLAFRHSNSADAAKSFKLHGLDPGATYELKFDTAGSTVRRTGAQLMSNLSISISLMHGSELIHYYRVTP